MKTISTTAIVALMTASLGLAAVAPAAAQQTPTPPAAEQPAAPADLAPPDDAAPALRGHRGGGGFGDILGFGRGAEGIEIALVRLSYAIDLTTEQQALFDTLRTDALAAAEAFETAVEDLRPDTAATAETATAPDLTERLENRIALQSAQLAALEAVQPSLTAFYDSLTDEQKAELMPAAGERGGRFGPREGGPGMGGHGPMGGQRPGGGFKG
jgi:hypothetical protein